MGEYQQMGTMLLQQGKITQTQLDIALKQRSRSRRRIGGILVSLGYVTDRDVAECLAIQYGLKMVDPAKVKPDPQALRLLDTTVAISRRVLPLRFTEDCIECIVADPLDFPTTDMITNLVGKRVMLHIAPMSSLLAAIRRIYDVRISRSESIVNMPKPRKHVVLQKDRRKLLEHLSEMDIACMGEGVS